MQKLFFEKSTGAQKHKLYCAYLDTKQPCKQPNLKLRVALASQPVLGPCHQQLCTYVCSELQEAGTTHCGERHGHFRCPLVGTCYAIPICWFLNMPGLAWIPLGPDLIKNHREHACDRSWCLWKLEPGVGRAPVVWKLSDQSVSWPCLIKVSLSQKTVSWHSESLMCCAYVGPKTWGHWTPLN